VSYTTAQGPHRDAASTLIVNRDAADWLRLAREDELARLTAGAA